MPRIALIARSLPAVVAALILAAAPPASAQDGTPLVLVPELLSLSLAPGDVVLNTATTDLGIDLRLTNEQGQILRIMAGVPDRALVRQLRRFLDRVDSVAEGSVAGQPAWLVRGITDRSPTGGRDGVETAALMIVPQVCDAAGSPFAVAVLTEPGAEGAAEAVLGALSLTPPEGGGACAEVLDLTELTAPPAPEPTPAAPDPGAPEQLALLGDQVMLTLPAGAVVDQADLTDDAADIQVTLAEGAQVRVLAMVPVLPILDQVPQMLHRIDAVGSADLGGMMVSTAEGPARASVDGAPADESEAPPSRLLVPQVCVEGQPPYVVQLTTQPGFEAAFDAVLQGLGAAAPEGAVDCPDVLFGLPMGAVQSVEAEEGWVADERFGIRFALPAGAHVRLDRAADGSVEYWAQVIDNAGNPASEFSLFIMDPQALARKLADEGVGADRAGFEAMLSRFANAPMQRTDESMVLDDVALTFYRNAGPRRQGEAEVSARILFLIAESPAPSGLSPWAVIASTGQDPATAQAFEDGVLASLGGSAVSPPPAEGPVASGDGSHGKVPHSQVTMAEPQAPVTSHPLPVIPPGFDDELGLWAEVLSSGRAEGYWTYLKAYPQGQFAEMARIMLAAGQGQLPAPQPAPATPSK